MLTVFFFYQPQNENFLFTVACADVMSRQCRQLCGLEHWQWRQASCHDSVGGYKSHLWLWQFWDQHSLPAQPVAAEAAQGMEGFQEAMARGPTNPPNHSFLSTQLPQSKPQVSRALMTQPQISYSPVMGDMSLLPLQNGQILAQILVDHCS